MIDLHMHSTCSDGIDKPNVLLEKAQSLNLEYISITDHNNCLAYEKIDSSLYSGQIITGCEMATSFEGQIIEILGYGVDTNVINNWFREFYSDENLKNNEERLFERFLTICGHIGIKLTPDLKMSKIEKGLSKKTIYNDIIKYEENFAKLPKSLLDSYRTFFRNGLSNPQSTLFVGEHLFYPSLEETIKLIKNARGLAFLAHLFEYKVGDSFAFLERMRQEITLDGLECYHSTFTSDQIKNLLNYAKKNKLFISGGSDYHGKRSNVNLGTGSGNLAINKDVISDWLY